MVFKTTAIIRWFSFITISIFLSGMAKGPPFVGGPAPYFELETVDGQTIKLSDLQGKIVVLNFWATWCVPCIKEMPEFQKAHSTLADKGVEILAVNFGEKINKVSDFIRDYRLSFPVLLDRFANTSENYKVLKLPVTYFITPNGIIQEEMLGGGLTQEIIKTKINAIEGF